MFAVRAERALTVDVFQDSLDAGKVAFAGAAGTGPRGFMQGMLSKAHRLADHLQAIGCRNRAHAHPLLRWLVLYLPHGNITPGFRPVKLVRGLQRDGLRIPHVFNDISLHVEECH